MIKDVIIFHVSPSGDDAWSGRSPFPDGADGPFATIAAARDAARSLRKARKSRTQRICVLLRGGIHYLDQTFQLLPEDSGTADSPVIYAAYPGEGPVLSGGRRIGGWSVTTMNGMDCWVADLPSVRTDEWCFTQLFVNGRRAPRPRLPKMGHYEFTGLAGEERVSPDWTMHGPRKANFAPGHIRAWKNLSDIEVVALARWYDSHNHIDKVDEKSNTVFFKKETLGSLFDSETPSGYSRYCLENVFEALDTPGEWYLDRQAGKLFYLPLETEKPETAVVVAPLLSEIVRLQGSEGGEPVAHVRFENIAFQHAEWVLPADDPGSVQAAFKVPGAVVFDCAENCVLYGCSVSNVSQYGVELLAGCANNKIIGCSFFDMGAGGVKIGHEELLREDDTNPIKVAPNVKQLKYMRTTVSDCAIHDGGVIYPGAIGAWIGNSGRNTIIHNHIFNMPYAGVSCGWTWGYEQTRTIRNIIKDNHVHHIGNLLHDNGGIYMLGCQPGTIVCGNLIHDIVNYGSPAAGGHGIYPDEGSSMITFENNIVHHVVGKPFNLHFGYDNWVRNNIFVFPENMFLNSGKRHGTRYSSVFTKNIFLRLGGNIRLEHVLRENAKFEKNLFWQDDPADTLARILNKEALQGQHAGSVIANPLLTDPESGDFSLREDSPALKLGFKPIDMSTVGPRFMACRPATYEKFSKRHGPGAPHPLGGLVANLEPLGQFFQAGASCMTTVRLVVENIGEDTASGKLRITAGSGRSAVITGKSRYEVTLAPGEKTCAEFMVTPKKTADRVFLDVIALNATTLPTSFHEEKSQRKVWRIGRIPPSATPSQLKTLLAGAEPLVARIFHLDCDVAQIRIASCGDNLAIHAVIKDRQVRTGTPPWNASCLVLFSSKLDATTVAQVNFQPPESGDRALATLFDGHSCVPDSKIHTAFSLRPDGYELCALVPFSSLSLEGDPEKFLLELNVITAPAPTGAYQGFGVFEHPGSPTNNAKYGLIAIKER